MPIGRTAEITPMFKTILLLLPLLASGGLESSMPAPLVEPAAGVSVPAKHAPESLFAPAIYTLRGAESTGSSLVLLDAAGRETVVATDPRPAHDGSLFTAAHASAFGPFSMTPDGGKVLYTVMGKPSARPRTAPGAPGNPSSGPFGSAFVGGGSGREERFNRRDIDGIFLWNRDSKKTECLWKGDQFIDALKDWARSPQGKALAPFASPQKLVDFNGPKYLFQQTGDHFLLVLSGCAIQIDVTQKTLKPLYVFSKREVDPPHMLWSTASFEGGAWGSEPNGFFVAWQEADGGVHMVDSTEWTTISPAGSVRTQWLPAALRFSRLDSETLLAGTERGVYCLSRNPALPASATVLKSHTPVPARDGAGSYLFRRGKFLRLDKEGEEVWATNLRGVDQSHFLVETPEEVAVLANRNIEYEGNRLECLILNPRTGKVISSERWRLQLPNAAAFAGDFDSAIAKGIACENDWISASQDGITFFSYLHRGMGHDSLTRMGVDGRKRWQIDLGDCRKASYLIETRDKLTVLVKRSQDESTHRLALDPSTGKVLEDIAWPPSAREGACSLTFEFLPDLTVFQTPEGALAWVPSRGKFKAIPEPEGWRGSGEEVAPLRMAAESVDSSGTWASLDSDMMLRPLRIRPLADQVSLAIGGHCLPVPSWNNQGIKTGDKIAPLLSSGSLVSFGPWNGMIGMSRNDTLHIPSTQFPFSPALLAWAAEVLKSSRIP